MTDLGRAEEKLRYFVAHMDDPTRVSWTGAHIVPRADARALLAEFDRLRAVETAGREYLLECERKDADYCVTTRLLKRDALRAALGVTP